MLQDFDYGVIYTFLTLEISFKLDIGRISLNVNNCHLIKEYFIQGKLVVKMSKRIIFPQQNGERKKAKLDITISDHNFPLSQNRNPEVNNDADTWGDDSDDEMLLLMSQACEQAYSRDNTGLLPDYTICMQPSSTSTQLSNDPGPSTSKTEFTFKKPSTNAPSCISTHLKDKIDRISSPLPGLSSNIVTKANGQVNLSDDLIFNEKVYKDQDSQYIYRQLLQLQEEHAKLKSENGKLFEKCMSNEGEASILRTQLKTYQMAVDNARLEKIKAQEEIQMEWMEKLSTVNNQLADLKTQLEFKNMEVISLKQRAKILESSKVKLTQVSFPGNHILSGHKHDISVATNSCALPMRKIQLVSSIAQTDNKARIIKLNNNLRTKHSKLNNFLPLILEPNMDQQLCLLDYNEKLKKTMNYSQYNCRIFSTFHRLPSAPAPSKDKVKKKICLSSIHEDLAHIAVDTGDISRDRFFNVLKSVNTALIEVSEELEIIRQRFTTAFQREMDDKYIEGTSTFLTVEPCDLLRGRNIYNEEQAVSARRMTAALACVLESSRYIEIFNEFEENCLQTHEITNKVACSQRILDVICRICNLLYSTSCAFLYSGVLLSIITLIENLFRHTSVATHLTELVEIVKNIILSRPMPFVSCCLWDLMRNMSVTEGFLSKFCPGSNSGNLRLDYDQGVLLYKKDSCLLQILLKQTEASLKCIDKQSLQKEAIEIAANLIALCDNSKYSNATVSHDATIRCDCRLVLLEVIVYALRICAFMLHDTRNGENPNRVRLTAICRSGVTLLYRCVLVDPELGAQLSSVAGLALEMITYLTTFQNNNTYRNMLSELSGAFQTVTEETLPPYHRQAWVENFDAISLVDD